QVDARDATRAPIGAVVGHNTPETTDDDFGKIGLGDGNTYTQAQIDARGATAAPATAIKGLNVKFVQGVPGDVPPKPDILATGAGDGNTYTQANLDKRTGGDKVAPIGAVIGVNIAGKSVTTPAVGDGSGKTYTQAQIDKRSRGDKVAPKDAIVGINGKETKPVKATGDGSGNTYTAAQVRLRDILKFG
ncbi:MAG: hypothetical protein KAG04_01595, partial [Mycoplasmataceae bacterium]|nr:hypothetical protein [Mycoplasmataceae bacterium]